ncbi:MAG TPA: metallophosphoesterase [Thermomicrobiales bacterium]|nr:metallophosphoesterase [Thermomicrobiales bacterium]
MTIPILAVSDETDPRLHSATVRDRLGHVAMVIGCGDLPSSYLEFLADALNRPVYYVLGNHADELRRGCCRDGAAKPMGAIDLGGRVVRDPQTGLILAGFPGSPRYGEHEPAQYAEWEIWSMVARMAPRLIWNRLRHGRALDVLVSHAPPRHVNDREDPAHRGYEALRPFLRWFRPAVQLHGHIHLYDRSLPNEQRFEGTRVVNVFPYKELELEPYPVAAPAVPTAATPVGRSAPLVPRRTAPGPASTEVP